MNAKISNHPGTLLLLILLLCGCSRFVEFHGFTQGGLYCVKADIGPAGKSYRAIAGDIEDILTQIDTTFSGYNRSSMLSRFNRGCKIVPSRMFTELLSIADSFKTASGGAFDHYGAPLFDIWGFGFGSDSLPNRDKVNEALQECKSHKTLNFNAVAQGYSCDAVAGYLESLGIHDYLVDIGEIRCSGVNAKGLGWSIGIDTPYDGNDSPGETLSGVWQSDSLCHGVVTSGNYRKFYIRDGRKYAHTIDPRSGYPVQHNLLSATVIAPTATEADAIATWLMVIGFEEARQKVLSDENLEACLICSDTLWTSPGFSMHFKN